MKKLKPIYLASTYLFLYVPIIIVVIFSFNKAKYSQLWHGFTLQWYTTLFHNSDILTAAWHSLLLATLAATIACTLALLAAISLFRYKFFGRKALHMLLFLMIFMPDILIAISLLILYEVLHIPLGFISLLIAHITLCLPFAVMMIYSRITTMDRYTFEAARDLGANEWHIFKTIIVPLMWPAILSSWLLSFTLSLDDIIISFFVSGPRFSILPLHIYSLVRTSVTPEINALSSLLLLFTLIIVGTSQWLIQKR